MASGAQKDNPGKPKAQPEQTNPTDAKKPPMPVTQAVVAKTTKPANPSAGTDPGAGQGNRGFNWRALHFRFWPSNRCMMLILEATLVVATCFQVQLLRKQNDQMVQQTVQMVTQSNQMGAQSNLMESQLGAMTEQSTAAKGQLATMIEQTKAANLQVKETEKAIGEAARANDLAEQNAKDTLAKMQESIDLAKAANILTKKNGDESLAKTDETIQVAKDANATAKATAQDSLNVAGESNKITRENGEVQLRAYVGVVMEPTPKLIFIPTQSGGFYRVVLPLKNYGQTPAYSVVTRSTMLPKPDASFDATDLTKLAITNGAGMTVVPGNRWELSITASGPGFGRGRVWVLGRVEYKDAFGQPRQTNFRFKQGASVGQNIFELLFMEHEGDSS